MNSRQRRVYNRAVKRAVEIIKAKALQLDSNHHKTNADKHTNSEGAKGQINVHTIREFIILLLALFVDVLTVWEHSHALTLWIAFIITAVFVYTLDFPFSFRGTILGILFIVTIVTQSYLPSNDQETEIQGFLIPANDPRPLPPPNCFPPSQDSVALFFGKNVVAYAMDMPSMPALKIRGETLLSFRKTSEGIKISAKIFNKDGIIAELSDNKFIINLNNYFRRERPDKHTLIVYDTWGKQALFVRYLNSKTIKILGRFFYPPDLTTVIDEEKVGGGGINITNVCVTDPGEGFLSLQESQ